VKLADVLEVLQLCGHFFQKLCPKLAEVVIIARKLTSSVTPCVQGQSKLEFATDLYEQREAAKGKAADLRMSCSCNVSDCLVRLEELVD